jgi:hypothetical protein
VTAKFDQDPDLDPHWFDLSFSTLALAWLSLEKGSCIFWNIKFVDYFSQCSPHSLKGMRVSGSPAANVPVSTLPVSSYLFIIPTSAFPLTH